MATSGEERMLILFGDIHYYFAEPSRKPTHHRFDKESYVYLYRDAANRRGRLEIANHAGTPEQDAFTGYMNATKITYSHKRPTLVTMTVDGLKGVELAPSNDHHWRLPSTDPRDEGKYLFRIHTLDIYFWTVEDANTFIRAAKQTLTPQQLDVDAPPPSVPQQALSPVVQNLENMAISDPAYSNTGQSQSNRSVQTQQGGDKGARQTAISPMPPPPLSSPTTEAKRDDPQPMAYNPAAPAAPEVHSHREKTPPPPEDGPGLTGGPYGGDQQRHGSTTSIPPPPGGGPGGPSPYASPPPVIPGQSPHGSAPSTVVSPPPGSHSSHRLSQAAQAYTPTSPPSSSPPALNPGDQGAHFYGKPPIRSPTEEILGASDSSGHRQPLQHLRPQYADYLSSRPNSQQPSPANQQQPTDPPSGYIQYDYSKQQPSQQQQQQYYQQNPYGTGDTSIHTQAYRPTEEEAKKGRRGSIGGSGSWGLGGAGVGGDAKPSGSGTPGQTPGKWDLRAEKAEKGINRFLKKVEKKIG